jgi:hypothetical protein
VGFERKTIEAVGLEWGEVQPTNDVLERLRAAGLADAWNGRNPLASALCGRAIMETTALLYDFSVRLEGFCEARNLVEIDALVMNRTFSGSERTERGAHRVGNIARRKVPVMLLDRPGISVAELSGNHIKTIQLGRSTWR